MWFQPLGQWDAWSQWTAKARSLRDLPRASTPLCFENGAYRTPGTPTTRCWCPSIEASDFTFMRHLDTRAIHLQFSLLYAGFLLALLELLRGRVREVLVWPFVLAIAAAPAMQIGTASAARRHSGRRSCSRSPASSRGAGSSTATRVPCGCSRSSAPAAYATKFEGRIFVVALSVDRDRAHRPHRRERGSGRRLRRPSVALVGFVPWWIWVANHHVVGMFSTSASRPLGERAHRQGRHGSRRRSSSTWAEASSIPTGGSCSGCWLSSCLVIAFRALPRERRSRGCSPAPSVSSSRPRLVYMATPLEFHADLVPLGAQSRQRRRFSLPSCWRRSCSRLCSGHRKREVRNRQYPLPP